MLKENTLKVLQKRDNADISFNRTYEEYVKGFGDKRGNHWLGLRKFVLKLLVNKYL